LESPPQKHFWRLKHIWREFGQIQNLTSNISKTDKTIQNWKTKVFTAIPPELMKKVRFTNYKVVHVHFDPPVCTV